MKLLSAWDAIQNTMRELGKDSITTFELNKWANKYVKEHPNVFVERSTDDIGYYHDNNYIYWESRVSDSNIIHRQETIRCPICGDTHYKYPDVKKFELMKSKINW